MPEYAIKNARILIVDDQEPNVRLLESILRRAADYTHVKSTTDPLDVPALYTEFQPDVILLDLHMPNWDGFRVLEELKRLIPHGSYLPILVLTADITADAKQRALANGAKDFLTKPFDPTEVLLRTRNLLETRVLHSELRQQNHALEDKVRERTRDLERAHLEVLERLALAAEYRDDATGQHARRVGQVSGLLARALRLPQELVVLIRRAAPLHDVGKIGIPDDILLRRGPLTPAELELMKSHTTIGANILSGGRFPLLRLAEEIALTHHERWDGTGYPRGLRGEAIPLSGRIVAIADAFDALTHERPYQDAKPVEQAVTELQRCAGAQFEPRIVDAFLTLDIDSHHRCWVP
jgi:putative two-component system response regulator